jgi:hypothetical protein
MKTARFLLTIIASGSLALGLVYAGEPSSQSSERNPREKHATGVRPADPVHGNKDQMDRRSSKGNNDGRASGKSVQFGSMNTQTKHTSENELHQSGLKKAAAANDGLMMNKTGNHRDPLARLPVGSGITAPLPGAVRGRSDTEAVLGGLAASSAKNSAAALNGAAIKRKP